MLKSNIGKKLRKPRIIIPSEAPTSQKYGSVSPSSSYGSVSPREGSGYTSTGYMAQSPPYLPTSQMEFLPSPNYAPSSPINGPGSPDSNYAPPSPNYAPSSPINGPGLPDSNYAPPSPYVPTSPINGPGLPEYIPTGGRDAIIARLQSYIDELRSSTGARDAIIARLQSYIDELRSSTGARGENEGDMPVLAL
jgi:hypothetical protein